MGEERRALVKIESKRREEEERVEGEGGKREGKQACTGRNDALQICSRKQSSQGKSRLYLKVKQPQISSRILLSRTQSRAERERDRSSSHFDELPPNQIDLLLPHLQLFVDLKSISEAHSYT